MMKVDLILIEELNVEGKKTKIIVKNNKKECLRCI
jgi:hypothetical protein